MSDAKMAFYHAASAAQLAQSAKYYAKEYTERYKNFLSAVEDLEYFLDDARKKLDLTERRKDFIRDAAKKTKAFKEAAEKAAKSAEAAEREGSSDTVTAYTNLAEDAARAAEIAVVAIQMIVQKDEEGEE